MQKNCNKCEKRITTGSKSGLCKSCSRKGWKMPEVQRLKLKEVQKGNRNGAGKRKTPRTETHKRNLGLANRGTKHTIETINKRRSKMMGANNPSWKGGVTPIHKAIRGSFEYSLWRTSVFQRDNYTCIWCGANNKNGNRTTLHADHIKPFSLFPELRLAIDNGRTLCVPCHRTTETYCRKIKKC